MGHPGSRDNALDLAGLRGCRDSPRAWLAACGNGDQRSDTASTAGRSTTTTTLAPPSSDPEALAACAQYVPAADGTLVAAYESTAGTLRRWSLGGDRFTGPMAEPQFLQGRSDVEAMAVCYLDGTIPAPMPPPVPGASTPPLYNRAVLLVDAKGSVSLLVATHRDSTPVARPLADGP